jgi:hypothetical protein
MPAPIPARRPAGNAGEQVVNRHLKSRTYYALRALRLAIEELRDVE